MLREYLRNINMPQSVFIILTLILFLGLGLRFNDLNNNPPELFPDELINFVSARSIIEKGKDLQGKLMPYFSDRLEPKPPIYGYSAYFSSKFFGKSTFSIRLPAVMFGLITIAMLFILTLEFTNSYTAALASAFCLAIIPWHIHYSRVGWEPASFLPFLLSSIVFLIKGLNHQKAWLILLGFGFFSVTIYTYHGAPILSFLFLIAIVGFNYRYFLLNRKLFLAGVILAGIIALPYIWTVVNEPHLYERAKSISTFSNGITHETTNTFLKNYIIHFSKNFLFENGDPNLRHGAQTGVLYWLMLPFIIIGLVLIGKSVKKHWYIGLILFWLIIFPIGGSLTNDGVPHATRTLVGAPLFCLISGIGIWKLIQYVRDLTNSKIIVVITVMAILIISITSLLKFSKKYYLSYPSLSADSWEYGHKEVFMKVRSIEYKYTRACLANLPHYHQLQLIDYYLQNTPLQIIDDIKNPNCNLSGSIIVTRVDQAIPVKGKLIHTVYNLKKSPKYYIYVID